MMPRVVAFSLASEMPERTKLAQAVMAARAVVRAFA